MGKQRTSRKPVAQLNQALRRPDLDLLGGAIRSLPPSLWQERMFFMGVPDTDLRRYTGNFPATLRQEKDTHPVFVLDHHPAGNLLCPCSSRGNPRTMRYIRKGCRLDLADHVMDRDSFLVETFIFTMPLDSRFSRRLFFKGRVPEECIRGGRR